MQIIPSSLLPGRDREALRSFLAGCRDSAQTKGHFQVASISLKVRHIAPLAVLQSIYEPGELHFYVERIAAEEALAGAEAVVSATFSGEDRFAEARAFADGVLGNTVAIGDLDQPFSGPHFFCAFTFADDSRAVGPFPAATVFLPRWQVSRYRAGYGAVANLRVDADSDIDALTTRVWAAYEKFGAFDYSAPAAASVPEVRRHEADPEDYIRAVRTALGEIESGAYEKIVLARAVELEAAAPWRPLETLNRLRERFAGCFAFSFGGGGGRSFFGATPERLLRVRDRRVSTEAIAGSAPRGATASEDAALGRALLESEKDLREHACVRDSILRRLGKAGLEGEAAASPGLFQLANVQHLRTGIEAPIRNGAHPLEIAACLHPTPAVGGTPRDAAVARIRALEGFDRGLYAGLLGWFDHAGDGEFVVGIRSALIDGTRARLHAGAGIVRGSDPAAESAETELKLRALLDVLEGG
jgi:menaquinone-specific isochorismate synthase